MCGRYVSASAPDQIAAYFDVETIAESLVEPSYNVAPTNRVHVVYEPEPAARTLDLFKWGLIPFWAKDEKIGNKMINARSETAAEKNSFKRPLTKRRCIIPADGFFEWKKVEGHKTKQPMHITRTDGAPFAFAGLYEVWRGAERDQDPLFSCTILTCKPNEKMAEVHDRMPVMLPPDSWSTWLDPTENDLDMLQEFFVPAPSELITLQPVSTAVNNSRSSGAQLIDPIPEDEVLQPVAAAD